MGIVIDADHEVVFKRGENIKYNVVPEDIATKPENLFVRGLLTPKALDDIDADPENTRNATSEVKTLFDAAPGFVKQLRQSQEYRTRIKKSIQTWVSERLVNVGLDGSLEYLVIATQPYPYGVSYRGRYFVRSGGTTREMEGAAFSSFLLERAGKHWDGLPTPGTSASDLDPYAINVYRRKAIEKGRHVREEVAVPDDQVISDLKLIDGNTGEITRAALLLFHADPERYVTGASIKIAYFAPEGAYGANKSDDIIYYDEIHGPLISQVDKAVDLVYTKYLKGLISYDDLQRIETFMTPREAFREILLNAVNHKAYESGNPIQISVYDDKIVVFNQGRWPEDIDLEDVYVKKHSSYPRNPNIAKTFFNAGDIEAYGSGFQKIRIECDKANAPYPEIEITPNGVTTTIHACELYMKLLEHGRYWETYPETSETSNSEKTKTDARSASERTKQTPEAERSIDRMMEIFSTQLSDKEKVIFYRSRSI